MLVNTVHNVQMARALNELVLLRDVGEINLALKLGSRVPSQTGARGLVLPTSLALLCKQEMSQKSVFEYAFRKHVADGDILKKRVAETVK